LRKKVLLILPEKNFNEREFLTIREKLSKNRIALFIASDAVGLCSGNNGLKVKADMFLYNIHPSNFDALCICGGDGIRNYSDNIKLHSVIKDFFAEGKLIAAICAAPVLLAKAGILENKNAVCFPSDRKVFKNYGVTLSELPVVKDKNIITGADSEASEEFATVFTNSLLNN